jgi:hypothetical protein
MSKEGLIRELGDLESNLKKAQTEIAEGRKAILYGWLVGLLAVLYHIVIYGG